MTAMVQTDLGPPTTKYKEDSSDDPLRHANAGHQSQPHPRPASIVQQQKQRPNSPHQPTTSIPPGAYATQALVNGVPLQHQSPYGQPTPDPSYYTSHPGPYPATSTPGQYTSSGTPDLMAATAQMQRPYPPIYHTPQSSSPASVASPQTHDQHGRSIFAQSPPMASQMYGYPPYSPMNPVHPSPYAPHPGTQQHPLTSQPLMMPQTNAAHMAHPQSQTHATTMSNSPRMKIDPTPQQRAAQRPALTPSQMVSAGPPVSSNKLQSNQPSGTNPNAAPGPIPATTPQVVRQDSNGVQWIAFEYSRDRVKMEYTIRCDVESVNVENLTPDFKTENCVYPRACCSKEQYRGNRLVYETECNAVGWALAELNPPLRGKRGLIQRAVDSWRNSNQDPRLRSRRVRRMAKMNRRQAVQAPQPNHMTGATGPVSHVLHGNAGLSGPGSRPAGSLPIGAPLLHHHHADPDGNGTEDISGIANTGYTNGTHRTSTVGGTAGHSTTDLRTGQVFHGYSTYPPAASSSAAPGGPSMPPLQESGLDTLGRHSTVATSIRSRDKDDVEDDDDITADNVAIFGGLPEGKRRKFILVDDPQRGNRVRVKVMLDQVDMDEIPDSYRMSNSVFPRAYFPLQMKSPPGRVTPGQRYFDDAEGEDDGFATTGRTLVPAPSIDGEADIAVPKLSRSRHKKEMLLNDLGYRMSWSQSRTFAGRTLFLQRSLDAYRNKMRSTMLTAGQEPLSIAPHFETRIGKRKWLERRKRNTAAAAAGSDSSAVAVSASASRRSAEEVEG